MPSTQPGADGVLREGSLYVWPERDHLKSFAYHKPSDTKEGMFDPSPAKVKHPPTAGLGMPGGFLSISADRNATGPLKDRGILWAALPVHDDAWIDVVPGALRAFEIKKDGSLISPLWTSYCAESDPKDRFDFGKYVPPTVANGLVYLATFSGSVRVYGLFPPGDPPHPDADPACDVSAFVKSSGYPRIKDPKGVGYRQTTHAARGRTH